MSSAYRVALIGCGGRGREHALGLKADPRGKVVALSDIKRETAEALNSEFEFGATVYDDHTVMLASEKPDIVIVCLWTTLHLPVFRDCVEAGVRAVLSEKPMAPTWGECLELSRLAEESGTMLTFCHQRRFAAGNQLARRLINEGHFGAIERMDLYSPKNLLDCGTHTFDQALSFNGESPAKWVLGAVDATEISEWFGVSFECMAEGTVVFENGVRANIQVGGPDSDRGSGVRVYGKAGFFEVDWDGKFGRSVVYADPRWQMPAVEESAATPMIGVIKNALDCLESGEEPELSHQKALRASEIIFALYESVRRHARVSLPLSGFTDNPFTAMLDSGAFTKKAAE